MKKKQWSVVTNQGFRLPPSAFRLRAAFTLVELLVVIAIIGTLMALLLPAVNNAREQGRRATCLNNMKQLSTALHSYEATKRELPGYANSVAKVGTAKVGRLVTWPMMLFPYIERTDAWQVWSDNNMTPAQETSRLAAACPYMEIMICPSNPPVDLNHPWLSFVANCGKKDPTPAATIPPSAGSGTPIKEERLANGIFFDRYTPVMASNKTTFQPLVMSLDHIPDGASNTLLLSENVQTWKYTMDESTDTHSQYETLSDVEALTGFVWDAAVTTTPSAAQKINGDRSNWNKINAHPSNIYNYAYARPASFHSGGVNVAMCGGELFFMRDDIDYKVYQQLMTSDGRHSDMPGDPNDPTTNRGYILSDQDYK